MTDASCGVIPVHVRGGRRCFLLVQHRKGHWGFPKGHPRQGETPRETALRELAEETGIRGVRLLKGSPLVESYRYTNAQGRSVCKTVTYFIGFVNDNAVTLPPTELSAFVWGDLKQTMSRLSFAEGRDLLGRCEAALLDEG